MTRTIEVAIPDDLLGLLDEKARSSGLQRDEYLRALLSKDLLGAPPLSEILAPFRAQVAASGMTEEQLSQLFSAAREEAWEKTLER